MGKSTVVIPNYNGIKYIENCLKSLYESTICDFDIIVIDNASTDGSLEVIKEKFPQVTLVENEKNEGFSYAVNQGITMSKTAYVILLNNDTVVTKNFVTELEKVMDDDDDVFSASAKMISLHDQTKIDDAGDYYCALGWAFARGKGKNPEDFQNDCDIFAACAGAAIYRRELFAEIGLFDVNHFAYFEDIDVGYRAKIYGYRNRFAAKAVVYHAGSATSGSRYNEFKTNLASRNSVYIVYKNMPVLQLVLNLPFLLLGFLTKTVFFIKKGYGMTYIKGLGKGIALSGSKTGKGQKVRFKWHNFVHYVQIQLTLWRNLFKIFS